MVKKALIVLVAGVVVGGGAVLLVYHWQQGLQPVPVKVSSTVADLLQPKPKPETPKPNGPIPNPDETKPNEEVPVQPEPKPEETIPSETTISIPSKFLIEGVPFTAQAPTRNWELPFQEACEEASVLMVNRFYTKRALPDDPAEIDKIITDMATWGEENMDGKIDTDAKTSARYFTEYLEYDPKRVNVVYDMSIDDIKAVIASGKPVIVPAAGRDLGNEHFQNPGPIYHMLVIVGYDSDEFIVNDPGTRFGQGYRYDQHVLFDAIHDLTPDKENIRQGRKAMIVVGP